MKVGWLQDDHGYIGGAEMTAAEFYACAPEGVDVIPCPPGQINYGCDRYVAHNAVQYSAEELDKIEVPITKYAHDLFLHDLHGSRGWLADHAEWLFCSPPQRDRMRERLGVDGTICPPPLNLPAERNLKQRSGATVSIAQWRNPGKGPVQLAEYAAQTGPIDVYGPGQFRPVGEAVNYLGELKPVQTQEVLAQYRTFVFLPTEFEPFCRTVVEAYFAGCEIVTNGLIGARWYLEGNLDALELAGETFWSAVTGDRVTA